jgi:D-alanine-D-alanine ligase
VKLPADVTERLKDVAVRVYHLLGARDYARVDTRVTPAGEVFVLEMNPNPAITSVMIDEGLPETGATYDRFIGTLVRNAVARSGKAAGTRRVRA